MGHQVRGVQIPQHRQTQTVFRVQGSSFSQLLLRPSASFPGLTIPPSPPLLEDLPPITRPHIPPYSLCVPSPQAALGGHQILGHPKEERANPGEAPVPFPSCPELGGAALWGPSAIPRKQMSSGVPGGHQRGAQACYLHSRFPRHPSGSISTRSTLGVQGRCQSKQGPSPPPPTPCLHPPPPPILPPSLTLRPALPGGPMRP